MQEQSLVVGMDYHKNIIAVCVKYQDGQLFHKTKFSNTEEDVAKWWERLPKSVPVTVCIESTDSWTLIYYELRELGAEVKITNSYKLSALTKAGTKSDKRDAEMLCDLELSGFLPTITIPGDYELRMRRIFRLRANFVKKRTATINQLRAILRERRLKAPTKSLWSRGALEWLRNEAVETVGPEDAISISVLADEIEFHTAKIKGLEAVLTDFVQEHPVARTVKKLPGFGTVLSSLVAVELKPIENFDNRRKMTAYGGTVPMNFSSGGKERQWRMTKACNKYLQWAFIEAAVTAVKTNATIKAWYERQLLRMEPPKARIKVAHKLQRVLYYLLKNPSAELDLEKPFYAEESA